MQFTEEQIISFQKLYKDELGIEITEIEALEKVLALLRYMELSVVKIEDPLST